MNGLTYEVGVFLERGGRGGSKTRGREVGNDTCKSRRRLKPGLCNTSDFYFFQGEEGSERGVREIIIIPVLL